jgi:NADH:ubiquinone oxidoreductase subunit F (NADH-binding)
VHVIGGGFVAGEARSVVRALSGGEALPPGRRTLPTDKGVDGHPTFLSNAETFAQIASLVQMGVAGYASVGAHDERGTTLLTVNGAVEKPGVYEVPLGTSLGALLHSAGSHPVAGLAVGGYHGAWVTPRTEMPLSRAGLSKQGGVLGAGVVLVIDDSTCALGELARIGSWLSHQSARQCGPCMFGLPALTEDLVAIIRGKANAERPLFRHASMVSGRGACAHPDGAARFLTTGITALARDVDTHRRHGNCGRPLLGQLPIDRR